jgi:hypothetical protein
MDSGVKELSIEEIEELLIEGETFRQIANRLNCSLRKLHAFISTVEHSARARMALEVSASTYDDMAIETLKTAEGTPVEIQRARELAQHYRWKAAKRAPKQYGDKVDIDHTTKGDKVTGEVDYSRLSDEVLQQIINAKKE